MQYNHYRFKFYFNASHAIYLLGELGQSHPHTWEIMMNTVKITDSFMLFNEIENTIEAFLSRYQDVSVNTVEPFTTINPTLENICTYFKECIQEMLYEMGWLLLSIELSETPTRSYVISVSNELDMNKAFYNSQSEETLKEILDKLTNEKLEALINLNKTSAQEALLDDHEQSTMKSQKALDNRHSISGAIFKKPHTWEIIVNTVKIADSFVLFNEIENTVESFLSRYQDVSINPVEPFTTTNLALENICTYFSESIQGMLSERGWLLLSIELSEAPTRSYVINVSNELDIDEDFCPSQSEETLRDNLDELTKEQANALINLNETSLQEVFPDKHEQSDMKSQKAPGDRHSIFSTIFRRIKKS